MDGIDTAGAARSSPSVVFHADDFGETVEITRGIVESIESGVLRSTTILANMPGSELAVSKAVEMADQASFGVHINLCEGTPLTSAPGLVDELGGFLSKSRLARKAIAGRIGIEAVRREIAAQVDFVASGGVRVSHLDGHKHLHLLPVVREAVAQVAQDFGIERLRVTAERSGRVLVSPRRLVREWIAHGAAKEFSGADLRSPDRVRDLADFLDDPPESLVTALSRLSGVTEVFCHPGTAAADEEKPGSCDRGRELKYLCMTELRQALEDRGIDIVSYWEV